MLYHCFIAATLNNFDLSFSYNFQKEEELLQLCRHNHLQIDENKKKFDRLVMDDTVDINCVDADGNTPLMLLCKQRTDDSILQDVETLLTRRKDDVDVKVKNKTGESAAAIVRGRVSDLQTETILDTLVLLSK